MSRDQSTTNKTLVGLALFAVPVVWIQYRKQQERRRRLASTRRFSELLQHTSGRELRPPFPPLLQDLLQTCRLAYMSTVDEQLETSHLSLMRFTYLPAEEVIVMSTRRDTKKFAMLQQQKGVALLVHDFNPEGSEGHYSITLNGTCHVAEDPPLFEYFQQKHLQHHPECPQFIVGPDIAILWVEVTGARICNLQDQAQQAQAGSHCWGYPTLSRLFGSTHSNKRATNMSRDQSTTNKKKVGLVIFAIPWVWIRSRKQQQRRRLASTARFSELLHHASGGQLRPPFPPLLQDMLQTCRHAYMSTVDAQLETSHLSLMRFTYLPAEKVIVMSTRTNTKKYAMLQKQKGVALLVHDFNAEGSEGHYSITLNGTCHVAEDPPLFEYFQQKHLEHNPDYPQFIVGPDIAILWVEVTEARICNLQDQVVHWNVAHPPATATADDKDNSTAELL